MAMLYMAAGINHFLHPIFYLKIMPSWLPGPELLVQLSGMLELLFGVLLIFASTRRVAAWGLIFLLIAVFPANVQMMLDYWKQNNQHFWLTIARLPLQFFFIWWAFQYAKLKKPPTR